MPITTPEEHPDTFKELVDLIRKDMLDTAAKTWNQIMEDRFMEGAAWAQEDVDREPSAYYDRD